MTRREPISAREKRLWQNKLGALVDAKVEAEENILVGIHEAVERGLSYSVIGGAVSSSPSGIAAKAAEGARILAERKGRRSV